MTTKASKKSRSSYSYSHAAKSAKKSRYGSLSLSFSYGATDDYYDAASASALHSADAESTTSAIPAEGSTAEESESSSAVADHDDDNEEASSTSDAHEAVSTITKVSTAVPQSPSTTTELNGGGTNMMPILTIDDLSPPPYVNLSLADSVSIKELASPPNNETPANITPTLSKVGIIGITVVAAIMFVFALARGKNRYEQQRQRRRSSRGCDGEVATDEQEDDEIISDLSSVWSVDDHAPEQRDLE
eukprot:scaffold14414_cov176-Skeletonema_dohrnii-CCMP3373.AAC.1